jgi:hypothetical protein
MATRPTPKPRPRPTPPPRPKMSAERIEKMKALYPNDPNWAKFVDMVASTF